MCSRCGCAREIAFLGYSYEIAQMPQLHLDTSWIWPDTKSVLDCLLRRPLFCIHTLFSTGLYLLNIANRCRIKG